MLIVDLVMVVAMEVTEEVEVGMAEVVENTMAVVVVAMVVAVVDMMADKDVGATDARTALRLLLHSQHMTGMRHLVVTRTTPRSTRAG